MKKLFDSVQSLPNRTQRTLRDDPKESFDIFCSCCVLSSNWVQDCKQALYFEKHDLRLSWFTEFSRSLMLDWWFGLSRSLKWSRKTVSSAAPGSSDSLVTVVRHGDKAVKWSESLTQHSTVSIYTRKLMDYFKPLHETQRSSSPRIGSRTQKNLPL